MKARVKATGEIVDVSRLGDKYIMTNHPHSIAFNRGELDFEITDEPNYWEKLKHQYAGMAIQGMLANPKLVDIETFTSIVCNANTITSALIDKLKEEEINEGKALLYAVEKTTERTEKEVINKVINWLGENLHNYAYNVSYLSLSRDLKQAMKNESK